MADDTISDSKFARKIKGISERITNDLTGHTYGRLTVVDQAPRKVFSSGASSIAWNCICICGNKHVAVGSDLRRGYCKSCGCIKGEKKRTKTALKRKTIPHGTSDIREYRSWLGARSRTRNKNNPEFHRYGARGIDICPEWASNFKKFLSDMGPCPKGYSLDRIDNNKGYYKDNCRWASPKEQSRNRRITIFAQVGNERRPIAEWSEITGIPRDIIQQRLRRGWPDVRAVFEPNCKKPGE